MIPTAWSQHSKRAAGTPASWCILFNTIKDAQPGSRLSWTEVGALYGVNSHDAQWTRRTAILKAISELAKYDRKVTIDGKHGLVIE